MRLPRVTPLPGPPRRLARVEQSHLESAESADALKTSFIQRGGIAISKRSLYQNGSRVVSHGLRLRQAAGEEAGIAVREVDSAHTAGAKEEETGVAEEVLVVRSGRSAGGRSVAAWKTDCASRRTKREKAASRERAREQASAAKVAAKCEREEAAKQRFAEHLDATEAALRRKADAKRHRTELERRMRRMVSLPTDDPCKLVIRTQVPVIRITKKALAVADSLEREVFECTPAVTGPIPAPGARRPSQSVALSVSLKLRGITSTLLLPDS